VYQVKKILGTGGCGVQLGLNPAQIVAAVTPFSRPEVLGGTLLKGKCFIVRVARDFATKQSFHRYACERKSAFVAAAPFNKEDLHAHTQSLQSGTSTGRRGSNCHGLSRGGCFVARSGCCRGNSTA